MALTREVITHATSYVVPTVTTQADRTTDVLGPGVSQTVVIYDDDDGGSPVSIPVGTATEEFGRQTVPFTTEQLNRYLVRNRVPDLRAALVDIKNEASGLTVAQQAAVMAEAILLLGRIGLGDYSGSD